MNGLEFYKDNWDYRKSIGGWAVDAKINGVWTFIVKLSSKKDAIAYIKQRLNESSIENSGTKNQAESV